MIYIHAGYPKAASTTIQRFLWMNASVLASHGLIYPKLFDTPASAHGANPHTHNALARELSRRGPGPAWEQLRGFVREHVGHNIILSGENFCACQPDRLRAALGDEPVKIVFYIKDLAKTVVSIYAQRTKTGKNTDDFDAFFDRLGHPRIALPEFFSSWTSVFGVRNIAVHHLDSRSLAGGDIRTDVLDAAGLSVESIDPRLLDMTRDMNISPGWKTLEILRDLKKKLAQDRVAAEHGGRPSTSGKAKRRPKVQWKSEIWIPARRIEESLGLTERGNYLTDAQFVRCAERFNAQVDVLEKMGMDTNLVHATCDGFVTRAFLPSIEHVPADEVSAFLHQLLPERFPNGSNERIQRRSQAQSEDEPGDRRQRTSRLRTWFCIGGGR